MIRLLKAEGGAAVLTELSPTARSLLALILGMGFAMHLISCFWYLAGSSDSEVEGPSSRGTKETTQPCPIYLAFSSLWLRHQVEGDPTEYLGPPRSGWVSAPQSTRQLWTVLTPNGPINLGIRQFMDCPHTEWPD